MNLMCKKIKFSFLIVVLTALCLSSGISHAEEAAATATQPKQCNASCSNSGTCHMPTEGGHLVQLSANSDYDGSCLAEKSKDGCFNPMPVSCGGSYKGLGYRPNGAGGNSKPRNHLGSDIGGAACKDKSGKYLPIAVYAAADGEVKYAKTAGYSGRTVVIEHTKGCSGAPSGGDKYKTTYRHLLKITKGVGSIVKKGEAIGMMGGSNSLSIGSAPCDNIAQAGWDGYTTAGCGAGQKPAYYAIHLHFEIEDNAASSSSSAASVSKVINPGCDNLQTLCGGCATDLSKCKTKSYNGNRYVGDAFDPSQLGPGIEVGGGGDYAAVRKECALVTSEGDNCTFCDMFKGIFNTASEVAKVANDNLAGPSRTLVTIGFLIWLAIYLLKQVSSAESSSTGEMLKGIIYQGFRVAVILLILDKAIYSTMDLTLNPVMETGFDFIKSLNQQSTCADSAEYMQGIKGYDTTKGMSKESSGGLSINVGKSLVCSVKNLEDSVSYMQSLGKYSICLSQTDEHRWMFGIFWGLGYLTTGIALWFAGLFLLLAFPWCLLDCMLNMCVAAALVPCGIATFAFKSTSKYLKIIWNFFMNALFQFVFMAILIYIINKNFQSWIGVNSNGEIKDNIFVTAIGEDGLAWWGKGFIKIGTVVFLCMTFFDTAKQIAGKFAAAPSLGGGKGIGGMVGGTLMQMGTNTGIAAGKAVGKGAKAVGRGTNALVGSKVRSGVNHAKGLMLSHAVPIFGGKSEISKDADGNTIYKTKMKMFGRTIERTIEKNENGRWTQTKDVNKNNVDSKFKQQLDKNGNSLKTALRDENGNIMKDANGNDIMVNAYKAGDKEMMAHMVNGKLVYATADGKTSFTMDKDGKIESFTQTNMLGRTKTQKAQYNTNRSINDTVTQTKQRLQNGKVVSEKVDIKNEGAKHYLYNKDGTINTKSMMTTINNAKDKKAAGAAVVAAVMKGRGETLNSNYKNRDVSLNKDGSITITQTNIDGSQTMVNAKMVGDIMVIDNQTTDKKGNITHTVSNGIQSKNEFYTKQKDGSYECDERFAFTDYIHAQNSHNSPLDENGNWGNLIDRDKAMIGFTHEDYEAHIEQIAGTRGGKQYTRVYKDLNANNIKARMNSGMASAGQERAKEIIADIGSGSRQNSSGGGNEYNRTTPDGTPLYEGKTIDDRQKEEREYQYKQEEKKLNEEKERLHKEYLEDEQQRVKLAAERDEITKQYNDIKSQLSAAKSAKEAVGLTPEEKLKAEKIYNELLIKANVLSNTLKTNRNKNNEAINNYNKHVEVHNRNVDKAYKK